MLLGFHDKVLTAMDAWNFGFWVFHDLFSYLWIIILVRKELRSTEISAGLNWTSISLCKGRNSGTNTVASKGSAVIRISSRKKQTRALWAKELVTVDMLETAMINTITSITCSIKFLELNVGRKNGNSYNEIFFLDNWIKANECYEEKVLKLTSLYFTPSFSIKSLACRLKPS